MVNVFKSELTLSESGFLFDHATGLTYTLNPICVFIFRHIETGKKARDILDLILKEFEVDEETARKDLDDFFRQLREFGLMD